MVTAWAAAIAALAHKLAKHIETTPRFTAGRVWLRRVSRQYLNAYAAGLLVAVGVSVLANSGHAVEFGRGFATPAHTVPALCRWGRYCVFGQYTIPRLLYSLAFGGIRPLVSLEFARTLANTADDEAEANPDLTKAKQTTKELRAALVSAEGRLVDTEARATVTEQRFAAAGDLVARLFAEEKRQRILAAAEHWPELPASSIAIISSGLRF